MKLQGELELEKSKRELNEKTLKEAHDAEFKRKDEEIAYYKDFKARQSTKMVGESLEQHCEIEFNRLRPTAFQNAYFEKDNDAKSGSKGGGSASKGTNGRAARGRGFWEAAIPIVRGDCPLWEKQIWRHCSLRLSKSGILRKTLP